MAYSPTCDDCDLSKYDAPRPCEKHETTLCQADLDAAVAKARDEEREAIIDVLRKELGQRNELITVTYDREDAITINGEIAGLCSAIKVIRARKVQG